MRQINASQFKPILEVTTLLAEVEVTFIAMRRCLPVLGPRMSSDGSVIQMQSANAANSCSSNEAWEVRLPVGASIPEGTDRRGSDRT